MYKLTIKPRREMTVSERLDACAKYMQNDLKFWVENKKDPNLAIECRRSLYLRLHDLTGTSPAFHTGLASAAAMDLIENGERPSEDHEFGGKKFGEQLMMEALDLGRAPDLEYIKEFIRRNGCCISVTKDENRILRSNNQDYSFISENGKLYRFAEKGSYVLFDGEPYRTPVEEFNPLERFMG